MNKPDPNTINKIPISYDLPLLENICMKKCIARLDIQRFSAGEKNCLDHCYAKGIHSVKHGLLCLGYL